jgi:hypothetical protein
MIDRRPTPGLRRRAASLAVVGALVLAACGDEGEEPATTKPSKPREPTVLASGPDDGPVSPVRDRLESLVGELLSERGLDEPSIECALEQLATTLTDDDIESAVDEIRKTGTVPEDVTAAAAAAGESCGAQ